MSIGNQTARSEADLRNGMSDGSEGVCVAVDWATRLVTVNVGGGEIVMPMAGDTPWVGDRVTVGWLGMKPWCLGSTARAPIGTVEEAPDAGKVIVRGDDNVLYRYSYQSGASFAIGDVVAFHHPSKTVQYVLSSRPDEELPSVPGGAGSGAQYRTFNPIGSGNFRNGSYAGPEFEVSDNRRAIYWYGTQIRDSIPAGAVIQEASIYLAQEWDQRPATASRMGLHADGSNVGQPSLFGELTVPGGTQSLPLGGFIDALRGGSAFGVGLYEGYGWRRFGSGASSGQIFVRWQ